MQNVSETLLTSLEGCPHRTSLLPREFLHDLSSMLALQTLELCITVALWHSSFRGITAVLAWTSENTLYCIRKDPRFARLCKFRLMVILDLLSTRGELHHA